METNKDRLQLGQKYVVEDPTLPLDGLKDKEIKTDEHYSHFDIIRKYISR